MNTHLQRALAQIENNKSEILIKNSLTLHFKELHYQDYLKIPKEVCYCDLQEDDETCPSCNGEGYYKPSFGELPEQEIENKVLSYLENIGYTKQKERQEKIQAKESLIINHNTIDYQGDSESINYMSSILALANFKFIQAISNNPEIPLLSIYEEIYKQTLSWKSADNTVSNPQIESIAEALEKSMKEVSKIVGAE